MKRILFAIVAVSFAGTALAADAPAVFASKCAACHGKDGRGTTVGQKMGVKDITALKETEAAIATVISNGKGKMSAYKDKLSPDEIQALAKFIKAGLK
jgi:cytochrome c6